MRLYKYYIGEFRAKSNLEDNAEEVANYISDTTLLAELTAYNATGRYLDKDIMRKESSVIVEIIDNDKFDWKKLKNRLEVHFGQQEVLVTSSDAWVLE